MYSKPLVSICCLTYRHKQYISQCIEGFLMQDTNFEYEIIIHDDASDDGTREILEEYASKYPALFKLILQDENQYSKGIDVMSILFSYATGKYIAMCEGDDYWTDPLKLQKQIDFMESHPDYVMCSHRFNIYNQSDNTYSPAWYSDLQVEVDYNLNTLIRGGWYHHPLTVMFRSDKLNIEEYNRYSYSMDAVLFYYLLKKGPGRMFLDYMAVYRKHTGGVWFGVDSNCKIKNEFKARIGIYEVEQSFEAAFMLRHQFTKRISRKLMLKEWRIMLSCYRIISRYFGSMPTMLIFLKKMLLNKSLMY